MVDQPSTLGDPAGHLKVFISWSLPLSHRVALILRNWLPRVIQDVDPWVSSDDIEKGTWWNQAVVDAIETSTVGIVVITPANLERAWINFEAGALARAIRPSGGVVAPLLINVPGSVIEGPMASLQITRFEKDDLYKLVEAINARIAIPLKDQHLRDEFELKWPMLESKVQQVISQAGHNDDVREARPQPDILEDLVSTVRDMRSDLERMREHVPYSQAAQRERQRQYRMIQEVNRIISSEGLHLRGGDIKERPRRGVVNLKLRFAPTDNQDHIEQAVKKIEAVPKYVVVWAKDYVGQATDFVLSTAPYDDLGID